MHSITKGALSILSIGSLMLTACGGDDDATPQSEPTPSDTDAATDATDATDPPTTEAPAPTDPPATTGESVDTTTAVSSEPVIELAETDLGPVIVAADGLTLYMFVPDTDGEPTCTGGCAGTWPPYYVEDAMVADGIELAAGDGLDPSLLAVVAHPDGGDMLRYGDWPLYYYAGDQAPGDTNGQGVNDVWWVIDGSGAPMQNVGLVSDGAGAGFSDY